MDYKDPWAEAGNQAVGAIFKSIMSQPSAMEQQLHGLQTQKMQQDMELSRQLSESRNKLIGAQTANAYQKFNQRKNEQNVANLFSQAIGGVEPIQAEGQRVNPEMVGPMPAVSSPDMNGIAAIMQQFAGQLPDDVSNSARNSLGTMNALLMENPIDRQMGLDDNITSYKNTSAGFREGLNDPVNVGPGSHLVNPQTGESIFNAPFKQGGGSYITQPDGTVISIDGGQPPVGKTTRNKVEGQQIATAKMRGILDYARNLAQADPMNFGVTGLVKGAAQDATMVLDGLSQSLGANNTPEALATARQDVMNSGVDSSLLSGIFDPNLSALQTVSDLLVFQAASALAGQEGRSMSNEDVKRFKGIVGDPQSLFMNQQKFLSKLETIENIVNMNSQIDSNVVGGNVAGQRMEAPQAKSSGGLTPEKMSRLQELRAKRDAGTLQ